MYSLLLGLVTIGHPVGRLHHSVCDTEYTTLLMANIRHEMHMTERLYPKAVDWQLADTATLRPVTSDSLCRLALETIQRYMDGDLRPKSITLIYAGRFFVAQQLDRLQGSEFTSRYILDQSLLHVLYPCPNNFGIPPTGTCPTRKP